MGPKPTTMLRGDWTPSYMPCICCVRTMRAVYQESKFIVMLRHPIHRAYSRFQEMGYFARDQLKRNVTGVVADNLTVNDTPVYLGWEKFVKLGVVQHERCVDRLSREAEALVTTAAPLRSNASAADERDPHEDHVHVRAPMRFERECLQQSHVLGWSLYAAQLHLWLRAWGSEAILTVYTEDLADDPLRYPLISVAICYPLLLDIRCYLISVALCGRGAR